MNKKFEQEYREFMKANTPDIWDRIEAGTSASERANNVISYEERKPVKSAEKENKRRFVNYYPAVAIAGAAACLTILALGRPLAGDGAAGSGQETQTLAKAESESATVKTETEPGDSVITDKAASSSQAVDETKSYSSDKQEDKSSSVKWTVRAERKAEKQDVEEPAKDDSVAGESSSYAAESAEAGTVQEAEPVVSETGSEQSESEETDSSSSEKKKKKSSSSSDESVVLDSVIADGVAVASTETAEKTEEEKAAEAAALQAAEEARAAAEAAKEAEAKARVEAEKAAEETKTVLYTQVTGKVTAMKAADGEIIYTVKVIEDASGSFKKGKKLKMVSATGLEKKASYVLSFADDGSKTGSKTLYTIMSAQPVE